MLKLDKHSKAHLEQENYIMSGTCHYKCDNTVIMKTFLSCCRKIPSFPQMYHHLKKPIRQRYCSTGMIFVLCF